MAEAGFSAVLFLCYKRQENREEKDLQQLRQVDVFLRMATHEVSRAVSVVANYYTVSVAYIFLYEKLSFKQTVSFERTLKIIKI